MSFSFIRIVLLPNVALPVIKDLLAEVSSLLLDSIEAVFWSVGLAIKA